MTIIKFLLQKSGDNKKGQDPEVVSEPLTGKKKVAESPAQLEILFSPPRRSRTCFNLSLILIALLVLAGGVVGVVFLYKHLSLKHHVHQEHVKIPLQKEAAFKSDATQPQTQQAYYLEEDVEIDIDSNTERLQVPNFDDCRSSLVMHDFYSNYTAIVDRKDSECFVMKLDRKISPPKNFIDLLYKYKTGYYMPDIKEVREDYRVITPPLTELGFLGPFIKSECENYSTYKMEKIGQDEIIRIEFQFKTFAFSDMKSLIKERIFK